MKKFRCSVLFKFSFIIFLIEYLSYMFWKKNQRLWKVSVSWGIYTFLFMWLWFRVQTIPIFNAKFLHVH